MCHDRHMEQKTGDLLILLFTLISSLMLNMLSLGCYVQRTIGVQRSNVCSLLARMLVCALECGPLMMHIDELVYAHQAGYPGFV